jgi:tRNA(Ile)-lysidine synthase
MVLIALRQFFVKHDIGSGPVVVAASGGIDSTALLLGMAELRRDGLAVTAAHVNHHLRGAESEGDEAFVRELCGALQIALEVADGTLDAGVVKLRGLEAAAREVRYRRLREIAGSSLVLTAHQKDDQAETVLMRLLTGSGIAGLRGIHPLRADGFARPLLEVTRAELETFLRERGVTARTDSTNDNPRFLRNRLRVLVRELNAVENLAAVSRQAREQWPLLEKAIDDAESGALAGRWPNETWIREALLARLVRRLDPDARDFDAHRLALALDEVTRTSVSKSVEVVRRGEGIFVEHRDRADPAPFEMTLTAGHQIYVPELDLTVGIGKGSTGRGQRFELPAGASPRFVVRNRRKGDRFQPLGLTAPKKLKDFLIDRKIPAKVRDRLPLLVWNDEIVWIGGVEVSERFKVTTAPAGMLYEVWMEGSGAEHHSRLHRGTDQDADP